MSRLHKPVRYFAGFGLAGLISASVQAIADDLHWIPEPAELSSVGTIFGLFSAACFWIFLELRSAWKIALFICSCAAAYYSAMFLGVFWSSHAPALYFLRWRNAGPGADVYFVAGWVGGFVVLAAALLILLPRQAAWRVLLKAGGWSVVGGLLGALGYVAERLSAEQPVRWLRIVGEHAAVFVIWQTGMALLLAFALQLEQPSPSTRPLPESFAAKAGVTPSYSSSAFRVIFFAAILILLAYFVQWEIRTSIHHS